MRNFSSTVAISSALVSVSVENLKATRRALSKKMQAKLSTLYDIIDPQSNHRGYHDALQAAATVQERDTCIPWLAVHLKELDKVVRQPLTVLVDDEHLVNFTRYNRFMDRTKEILYYSPPDLEDKRHGGQLRYLSNQLRNIDLSGGLEQQLLARSKALSIRESSVNSVYDENLRRAGFGTLVRYSIWIFTTTMHTDIDLDNLDMRKTLCTRSTFSCFGVYSKNRGCTNSTITYYWGMVA
jgi:son of sevenless-like protein